jgi:hypothetical protein
MIFLVGNPEGELRRHLHYLMAGSEDLNPSSGTASITDAGGSASLAAPSPALLSGR